MSSAPRHDGNDDARARFTASLGFRLDDFQDVAIDALRRSTSVLVAAPTGAGKTVVGEFACYDALERGQRAFYTTPIKALSNQKFRDLAARYGPSEVGLLTGDRSVNGNAPIVVMTTEVLRNMIYERSRALDNLLHVVLDEVHYLADRSRGAVWEEVLIQLPRAVQVTSLSATVSNAETFGAWLDQVRGGCEVIIEERRPVPLRHHYFVNGRIHPTFRAGQQKGASAAHRERAAQALAGVPNPELIAMERRASQRNRVTKRGRRLPPEVRLRWPSRPEVIEELTRRQWLPAILFVFSRAGCDAAVTQLHDAGVRLTSTAQRTEIDAIVDTMLADIPAVDLEVLGVDTWRSALRDGVAAHHAGMVPAFKECVEVLFQRGLLGVVVATETLALGINMPARTVVLERLEKWNGDAHVMLTPGEYTQLTGRAGRRGIDNVGHAVVLHQRSIDFRTVAGLVGTRSYPLRSSFQPSYNMAINLLRNHDLDAAEQLIAASFAQYEADARVSRKADRLRELDEGIAGYAQHLACDAGDWSAYWALRQRLSVVEKSAARSRRAAATEQVRAAVAALEPGDVIEHASADGPVAVTGIQLSKAGTPLANVVTKQGALTRLGPRELTEPPTVIDRVQLPRTGNPRQRDYRRDVARQLRTVRLAAAAAADSGASGNIVDESDDGAAEKIAELRTAVGRHPCHNCAQRSDHERWQYRTDELAEEAERLRDDVMRATGSLTRRFARIRSVLTTLDYLDGSARPTSDGMRLARIYSDVDLLVAESLRRGVLDDLDVAELAGIAALFLYESRSDEPPQARYLPTARLDDAGDAVASIAAELREHERAAGLPPLRALDPDFVECAWRWAQGADLDDALGGRELTGGDFVRNIKQIADLLGQLRGLDEPVAERIPAALDALLRGIVEW
ncbi:MAG: DEAD/DEAH box helicase [Nitriliruptoraceae bacterium]